MAKRDEEGLSHEFARQCRYVEVIARCGSFKPLPKELFVTQPNLSSSIKDLELELGVQLLHQVQHGCQTDRGRL